MDKADYKRRTLNIVLKTVNYSTNSFQQERAIFFYKNSPITYT